MTSLSHKVRQRIWGYAKRNKRCILKEGMPHASAWSKIKDAYPKKVCHLPTRHVKKKDSLYPKKKEKERREMVHTKEFIHHPPTTKKYTYIHTCTSWSRFMTCFSFESGFWLCNIWGTNIPSTFSLPWAPHKSLSRGRRKKGGNNFPWWGN